MFKANFVSKEQLDVMAVIAILATILVLPLTSTSAWPCRGVGAPRSGGPTGRSHPQQSACRSRSSKRIGYTANITRCLYQVCPDIAPKGQLDLLQIPPPNGAPDPTHIHPGPLEMYSIAYRLCFRCVARVTAIKSISRKQGIPVG